MDINSLLCVCTGNICRSPLAERLLAHALPGVTVGSAGIGALEGHEMAEPAAAIAEREGLTPVAHSAQQITRDILREFELVLVMEVTQKEWIEHNFPEARGRVFMFSHWQGGDDIQDPFRLSDDVFERVYAQLASCTADWRQRLAAS